MLVVDGKIVSGDQQLEHPKKTRDDESRDTSKSNNARHARTVRLLCFPGVR